MRQHEAHTGLSPDLILVNGTVLTVDRFDREVNAVAIAGGRIVALGTNADIDAMRGQRTSVIDLDGRTLIPGLTDSHVHLADSGTSILNSIDVRDSVGDVRSIDAMLERIRTAAENAVPGRWLLAAGTPLQDMRLAERRLPRREELDRIAPENPVMVTFGAHVTVANSAALALGHVTPQTPLEKRGASMSTLRPENSPECCWRRRRRSCGGSPRKKCDGHDPKADIGHIKRGICAVANESLARA